MTRAFIQIRGAELVGKKLDHLTKILRDSGDLWASLGNLMAGKTRERIRTGKDIHGNAFTPSIRASEEGGTTLYNTGKLYNSIESFSRKAGCTWGVSSSLPYAKILNEGGTIKSKNAKGLHFKVAGRWVVKQSVKIPRRQFLGIGTRDVEDITQGIVAYLRKVM